MGADQNTEEEFKPRGAMAFFVLLLLFFITVYFSIYFQMLSWG
jgi:ABC-type Na+ efflux pump permease subunit